MQIATDHITGSILFGGKANNSNGFCARRRLVQPLAGVDWSVIMNFGFLQ